MAETQELSRAGGEAEGLQATAGPVNEEWFVPKHTGERYYKVMAGIHDYLRPNSYLEVGIRQGHSLALAHCPVIGIDPRFELDPKFNLTGDRAGKPPVYLFEETSDKFFADHDPCKVIGVEYIDFFFLDGAHFSEYLLRDFFNSEQYAGPDSMIALHDCIPIDIAMTLSREQRRITPYPVVYPNFWAGDVWRVIMMLKKYRPELKMHFMDAHPTGLVLVTGLDRKSTVLKDNNDKLVAEMKSLDLAAIGLRSYIADLPVTPTRQFLGRENLKKRFKPWGEDSKAS